MSDLLQITCPTQPTLYIPELRIKFVDGKAEVPAARLPRLKAYKVHGVVLPDEEEPEAETEEASEPEPAAAETKPTTRRRTTK